jgi:superfamily II DNA or RNA helicase
MLKNVDLSKSKVSYIASRDEKGKLIKNVANFGLKRYEKAYVRRNGEYHNFTVEAIDDIAPIITDAKIKQASQFIDKFNYGEAAKALYIYKWYIKYGDESVKFAIDRWLANNNFEQIFKITLDIPKNDMNDLCNYIDLSRRDTLKGRLKISSIGVNTKTNESVVPESWIDRIFESGDDIHNTMNNLPNRKNKPPVNFCCVYSMIKKENLTWISVNEFNKTKVKNYKIIRIKFDGKYISSDIINKVDSDKNSRIIHYNNLLYIQLSQGVFIKGDYIVGEKVSYLASKLQKCYRRVTGVDDILEDTIRAINVSPCYNLPDHQFIRVSGTRQLLWRTFISIIEDINGYCCHEIDMLTLLSLALVAQKDPDLQLSPEIINKIVDLAKRVIRIDKCWDWHSYEEVSSVKLLPSTIYNSRILNSLTIALEMPMMSNDIKMIKKAYTCILTEKTKYNDISKINIVPSIDENIQKDVTMSAFDMHCYPHILIELQGSLNFIPTDAYTLQNLAKFIWDYSSRFNERKKFIVNKNTDKNLTKHVLSVLKDIQYYHKINKVDKYNVKFVKKSNFTHTINKTTSNYAGRLAFINIFGSKFRLKAKDKKNPACEIIIAGDDEYPIKVKRLHKSVYEFMTGDDRDRAVARFINEFKESRINIPKCVDGYKWNVKNNHMAINIKMDDGVNFYVNKKKIKTMDASELLIKLGVPNDVSHVPSEYDILLKYAFYMDTSKNMLDTLEQLRFIANKRRDKNDFIIYDWLPYGKNIDSKVWRQVYSRFIMGDNSKGSEVMIGPVDRSGKKTHNSISYLYEGVIWRIVIVLESLYPRCIKTKTRFIFNINKDTEEYLHLNNALLSLTKSKNIIEYTDEPECKTVLWEHQQKSVDKIFTGYTYYGKRGFGDASHVGSGKTLTALKIMVNLYGFNATHNNSYGGFIVLLPNTKLYKTWEDEITKHIQNMNILFQSADGSLIDRYDKYAEHSEIKSNTIVITTMGRIREHPIQHPWILVVIDECLTIQNKDALQTEEAWRQVCYSQYGVLMMSATFFRSRFDKMLFMLRMLTSGLPETSEYLDTILSETMVCNITESDRVWKINNNFYELTVKQKNSYNNIVKNNKDQPYDKLYSMLVSYIHKNVDYVNIFKKQLSQLPSNRKAVIFTKSKTEADDIADSINDVGRYPEKKKHTVVSYSEGAYGLNDLVDFDTIIMRPPAPDILPQIKGRLDRHKQKNKELFIEYLIIKGTIEEASLDRLMLAKNFYNNHIMPLSEFYKTALLYKPE